MLSRCFAHGTRRAPLRTGAGAAPSFNAFGATSFGSAFAGGSASSSNSTPPRFMASASVSSPLFLHLNGPKTLRWTSFPQDTAYDASYQRSHDGVVDGIRAARKLGIVRGTGLAVSQLPKGNCPVSFAASRFKLECLHQLTFVSLEEDDL
ncbi:hypothetical protein BC830DRAFT_1083563 [Chytriomyces sp. MP71]|nr:hypothetical protein BC830DRAFT_1083563 [Chytriomyces sp. MP71]